LPVLPLDGGHLLELALPGGDVERRRMAARVSIAIAAAGGIAAYRAGEVYIGLLAILFASQNFATLKQLAAVDHRREAAGGLEEAAERHDRGDYAGVRQAEAACAAHPGAGAASWLVETLARAGRHDDAARVVGEHAGELPVTTMQRALLAAYRAGRFEAAGRIGDAATAGPIGAAV